MMQRPYHPAKYSGILLPLFARLLKDCKNVLDPFAGTGKIASIKQLGYAGHVVCNDIEPDWEDPSFPVDEWHHDDAEHLDWCDDGRFDAICTSPTYGNRMADHHHAKDASKRRTYTHCLGHDLHHGNTGAMQWGIDYREKHDRIYRELFRVLAPGGIFVLNVSNHVRDGIEIDVASWHDSALRDAGFLHVYWFAVPTPRMRFGQNREARVSHEVVFVFEKPDALVESHHLACDICKKSLSLYTIPVEGMIVCHDCHDRKMRDYYNTRGGFKPVGMADLKEIYSIKKKMRTLSDYW